MNATVFYHDIFDYPLTKEEIQKWQLGKKGKRFVKNALKIKSKNGFYFISGRSEIVQKRKEREGFSESKFKIAKKAATLLGKIPSIKMVGVTGALAMKNADQDSDIDLIMITSSGTLWTTRFIVYLLIIVNGFEFRRANQKNQTNKLCLNMWLDERDLIIKKRNIFTAHEIAQIIPVANKSKTYEKFLYKNRWILMYWPNSVIIQNSKKNQRHNSKLGILDQVFFRLQYLYMRSKITNETVTRTRAFFHPNDWSKYVRKTMDSKVIKRNNTSNTLYL